MAFHVAMRNMSPCVGGRTRTRRPSEDGDAIAPANCARAQMTPPKGGRAKAPLHESRLADMAQRPCGTCV